jgi:iron complex outermembrane receptor protein
LRSLDKYSLLLNLNDQMKRIAIYLFLFVLSFTIQNELFCQKVGCDNILNGFVFDLSTKEPLPFATVRVTESGEGVVTNKTGFFILKNQCEEEVHLEVRFIGYKTVIHHHDFHHEDPMIFLAPDETLLESVVIEASRISAFQTLSIQDLEVNKLALLSSSIGNLTEGFSGVATLQTGSNIAKPIIHGLHSNRVLIINDGLRHAYQMWGEGHAPEIDPSHVERIEVVKGAGTVKYGPEALGGVILYKSKRPLLDQSLGGAVGASYQSNGRAISNQLSLEQGSHRFAWNANGFGVNQADLSAPDYNLSNTGKREYGGSFNALFHQPKYELEVSGSYLDQELGILRGSLVGNLQDLQNAINRSTPSPTFEPTYDIQNPKHETQHALLKTDLSVFAGEHLIKVTYGIQRNIRKEFDVRRGELNDRPVIDLKLFSHTFEAAWTQSTKDSWSGNSGIQLFAQNSFNEPGSNPINFVPDYDVLNVGAYTIQSLNFDESVLELGIRVDHQKLSVVDTIRDVTFYDNKVKFTNATFTLGYRRKLSDAVSIFTNLGTAWRPPNVSELYSFGYHFSRIQFGLWRYNFEPNLITPLTRVFDQLDRPVPSEKSLKWVSGLEISNDNLDAEFIFHINRINNYIFLRPFGVTTNVAGTFPFFLYQQTDALFLGSDWDVRFRHTEQFTSEAKISYVYANDTENNQPFLEIPPLNLSYSIEYNRGSWDLGLRLDYMAQQWNAPDVIEPIRFQNNMQEITPDEIFDFMEPPNSYFRAGCKVNYQYKSLSTSLRVDNLLNTSYRSYTDRLRYFSDAMGRNISLSISLEF